MALCVTVLGVFVCVGRGVLVPALALLGLCVFLWLVACVCVCVAVAVWYD
ncbi:MAG: hypothetical protein P4L40_03850 [Terracidiphilus sp.]|nr:hypothetical protein [Terracidiphilus sp.]